MTTSVRCPRCGLTQVARPTCKGCGAVLGAAIPPSNATHPFGRRNPQTEILGAKAEDMTFWKGMMKLARSLIIRIFLGIIGFIFLVIIIFVVVEEKGRRKAEALHAAANNGMPFAEALEKHSGWFVLRFGERPSDVENPRGHADCGYAGKDQGRIVFHPHPVPEDPSQREKVYLSVRDFSQAESKVFTACPWVSVLYSAVMFQSWTVDVQVDAQGKIILAKEPRFYGD